MTIYTQKQINHANTELDSCPFCGGEAEINVEKTRHFIKCTKCGCKISLYRNKDELIDFWNNGRMGKTDTINEVTGLKCCPFCGTIDEAEVSTTNIRASDSRYKWVVNCVNGEEACYIETAQYDTEAEAINAWNRRHNNTKY